MQNQNASNGIAEDIIRSFVQVGSAELHVKTIIEKRVSELENGMVKDDDIPDTIDKIESLKDELNQLAEVRRSQMLYLYNLYGGKGDKEQWCMVKHLGLAMYTAFESYQASDNDAELLSQALELNKVFIQAVTKYLGVEITQCASCFSDILKAEEKGEQNDTKNTKNMSTSRKSKNSH